MTTDNKTIKVNVWRGGEEGAFQVYEVSRRDNQTVLDIVTEVQRTIDPSLAYRFSCRVGVCGTCAVMVNGEPRWACRTHVSKVSQHGELTLEPLRNMPRVKDLVVNMDEFFDKWQHVGADFKSERTRDDKPYGISPKSSKRKKADAAIECINCGICYASCDVVSWDSDYLGPAALNRAWTLFNDERHLNSAETLKKAAGDGGCGSCHTQGSCMTYCPVGLSPTGSIAGLKRASLFSFLKRG